MTTTDSIAAALSEALHGIAPAGLDMDELQLLAAEADASINRLCQVARDAERANNLDGALAGAVRTVIAAEDTSARLGALVESVARTLKGVTAAGATAKEALRVALLECGDPGAAKADTGTHIAYCTTGRPSVEVTDEKALPFDAFRTKAEPDKGAIMRKLAAGEIVPGARLRVGAPSITITAKRETAR